MSICILIANSYILASFYTILFCVCFAAMALKIFYHISILRTVPMIGFYYLYLSVIDFFCISAVGIVIGDEFAALKNTLRIFRGEKHLYRNFKIAAGSMYTHNKKSPGGYSVCRRAVCYCNDSWNYGMLISYPSDDRVD